jgi:ethanolamine utilization cobalamin adenosyltransferase
VGSFITETWLREHSSLALGTELHLPAEGRLTPAARTLLDERRIAVKFVDTAGRTYLAESAETSASSTSAGKEASRLRVHPLTSQASYQVASCALCNQEVTRKPEAMTHLDTQHLVSKNHPRLRLRGKLDSAIAHAVWVQSELGPAERDSTLALWLADLRSCLGNVLRAEVTGATLLPIHMGELDDAAIHRLSHDPLAYFGHDHIVPEAGQGVTVARLNILRALVRESELAAAEIYIDSDYQVARPDILDALNRLSSAIYVLMLLSYVASLGQPVSSGKIASWI